MTHRGGICEPVGITIGYYLAASIADLEARVDASLAVDVLIVIPDVTSLIAEVNPAVAA